MEAARRYDVKLVVSSSPPNHAIYDAIVKAALPKGCRSLNIEAAFTAQLDDKWEFSELCQQLELPVPAAHLITSRARLRELNSPAALQGRRFILKSIAYDSFARTANIFLPCSPKRLEELVRSLLSSFDLFHYSACAACVKSRLGPQPWCSAADVLVMCFLLQSASESCSLATETGQD